MIWHLDLGRGLVEDDAALDDVVAPDPPGSRLNELPGAVVEVVGSGLPGGEALKYLPSAQNL
jgi:hypothetical protein